VQRGPSSPRKSSLDISRGHAGDDVLLASVSINFGVTVVFRDSSNGFGDRNNQVVIENLKHDTAGVEYQRFAEETSNPHALRITTADTEL